MLSRRVLECGILTACICMYQAACKRAQNPPASDVQQAPAAPLVLSSYVPQGALTEYAPGLMVRKAYVAETGTALSVETWDLTVGPGKASSPAKLPGAAVLEVRSGQGVATVNGSTRDVRSGTVFSVDQGQELILKNRASAVPMAIRATVIHSGPK